MTAFAFIEVRSIKGMSHSLACFGKNNREIDVKMDGGKVHYA